MSFSSAPGGGTTVGQANYVVSLDTQAMLAGLAQIEQTTRTSAQQVVAALEGVTSEEKVVAEQTGQMAQAVSRDVTQIQESFARMGGVVGEAAESVKGLQGQFAGMAGVFGPAGLAVAGVTLGLNAMVDRTKEATSETVNFAKEVLSLQRTLGGSVEQASQFAAVFDQWGVSATTAERGMVILSKAINGVEDAEDGASAKGTSAVDAFKSMGIATEDAGGHARSLGDIYLDVLDKLNNYTDASAKNRDAQALLGRSWLELQPIIALGRDGFKELAAEAEKYGVQLKGNNVQAIEDFIAAQHRLEDANKGLNLQLGLLLSGPLTNMSKNLTETASDLSKVAAAARNAGSAMGDFLGEMGRIAQATPGGSGEVDLGQLQQLDAAAAAQKQADAEKQAAQDVADAEKQANERRAASAKALGDAKKAQLEAEKKADQELADQVIRNLQAQETANERSYQGELEALNRFKDERTRENEGSHQAALDQLKSEEDATTASYDAQIQAAEIARDKRTAANESTHRSILASIEEERKTDDAASKDRVANLEEQRDAEFANIDKIKTEQLNALEEVSQKQQTDRLQADQDLQKSRRQEDEDAAKSHQDELDRLKTDHEKALENFQSQRDEIEKTKQTALDAIQAEEDKAANAHNAALEHIQDEQRAAQAQHDSTASALDAQQRAAQDEHDAALKALQDQQQAEQDAHDLRLRQLQDEQNAEDAASQARQDALKAENDEESKQHQQRLNDIDAESKAQQAALQQQLDALGKQQSSDTFAAQQSKLQSAVTQAQTGVQIAQEIAQNTGDPNTVIAAKKALADAQAALDKANADRAVQLQKDAINQQISDLKDQTDAKKQAENDQYQAEKDRVDQEIKDEQTHLQAFKDSIAQQVQAANDELTAQKRVIQEQVDTQNAAFKQRTDQIAAEKRANDDALKGRQADIQAEQRSVEGSYKAFQQTEANKRRDADTTATSALKAVQNQTDTENKSYATATENANRRYASEQQSIKDTRQDADNALKATRLQEDQDTTARRTQVEQTAAHDHKQISDLYDAPNTGLIAIEKDALAQTISNLDDRKTKADETYQDEQTQIKATYDDKETGLIPHLQNAYKEQKTQYDLRKTDIDATYTKEKQAIKDTFDTDTGDPATSGLIPNLKNAYQNTKDGLTDQVTAWTQWKTDVTQQIQDAIDKVGDLIGKVKELQSLGGTVVKSPGDLNLPDDQQAQKDAKAAADAENQAAIDRARAASGGRGLYGGAPLSVAQFGPGSSTLRTEFGNATVDAACGPIAIEALARLAGNPQSFSDILAWATAHGYWSPQTGIENSGFAAISQHFGLNMGVSGNLSDAVAAIAAGHPVVINTPEHYALAQGYDPNTGMFDLGYTGETVYDQRYMTLDQLKARGGGFNNFFIPPDISMFGGSSAPIGSPSGAVTISVPSLGVNFAIDAPIRLEDVAGPIQATGDVLHGTVADWVSQALEAAGKPQSWLNDLMLMVAAESGTRNPDGSVQVGTGDPRARNKQDVNGQHAEGLLQTLPSTFIANVPPGLPHDIDNPVANAAAAINYISSRYGSPENTPYWTAHGGTFSTTDVGGYAAGGIIPEPTALLRLRDLQPYAIAGELGPERVAPLGGSQGQPVEHYHPEFHIQGLGMNEVVRELDARERRLRLLRGR